MRDHRRRQKNLFDNVSVDHLPQLDEAIQEAVTQLLVLWLQALAKTIGTEEVGDEQDQR